MDILYRIKGHIENIKRVFAFIPIIYKTPDWDWEYLVQLIIFKLRRMRKCILDNGTIEDSKVIHDEILTCENKLQEVLDDNWYDNEIKAFQNKVGMPCCLFERPNYVNWCKANPEAQEEYRKLLQKKNETAEIKFKEAFNFLRDNIRKWWD